MTDDYKFCCSELERMAIRDCLIWIRDEELKQPHKLQDFTIRMGEIPREIKLNEIYLFNQEFHQLAGDPFSFCPYCGIKL